MTWDVRLTASFWNKSDFTEDHLNTPNYIMRTAKTA
jgi:hypothetical protein